MPPARWTSSMCTSALEGDTLHRQGILTGEPVDVAHRKRHLALVRGRKQMQHGVGRAAHRDIERHCVLEGGHALRCHGAGRWRPPVRTSDAPDRRSVLAAPRNSCLRSAWVASTLPLPGSAKPSASVRQFIEFAVNIPEQDPQVGQAARSMIAESASLTLSSAPATIAVIRSARWVVSPVDDLAGLHRAARDKHGRDVQTHRRHQHAGGDLVAVADADKRIGAMRIDHVFDAVGDQLARGQAVEHAAMAHGDAVIDRDGVEFFGDTAGRLDLARDQLAEILQMHMARHELGEGVGDGDDRLAEIAVLHAGGAPQRAGAGHVAAVGGGARAIGGHG